MKVFDKIKTGNELEVHNWFYTEEGWIRLTNKELDKTKLSAERNQEDTPKIGWFKKFLYLLMFY